MLARCLLINIQMLNNVFYMLIVAITARYLLKSRDILPSTLQELLKSLCLKVLNSRFSNSIAIPARSQSGLKYISINEIINIKFIPLSIRDYIITETSTDDVVRFEKWSILEFVLFLLKCPTCVLFWASFITGLILGVDILLTLCLSIVIFELVNKYL